MRSLRELFVYINPFFFHYTVIYVISKFYQIIFKTESFWQWSWNKIVDVFGEDVQTYSIWVLNSYMYSLYWILGLALVFMELRTIPKNLDDFKVQQGKDEIRDKQRFHKESIIAMCSIAFRNFLFLQVIKVVLFNQLIGYTLGYLTSIHNLLRVHVSRELPSFPKVMLDLTVCMICHEVFAYYSHRILHYRLVYKKIHKIHHEFQAPFAITAIYCHPVEHIMNNIFPVIIGFPIMGCHIATASLWLTSAIITSLADHSGLHIPFVHSSEFHDYHHEK